MDYCFPCSPWRLYNTRTGGFLTEAYFRSTGADHTGQDVNGNGGGDTDKGAKVRSITKGIVVAAKWYPVWGNIVLIYHPGPGVWSQYAHLDQMYVQPDQEVKCGDLIGTIGKGAGNRYLAHLHFEIRTKMLPADYWPSSVFRTRKEARKFIASNYVDPIKFLTKFKAGSWDEA